MNQNKTANFPEAIIKWDECVHSDTDEGHSVKYIHFAEDGSISDFDEMICDSEGRALIRRSFRSDKPESFLFTDNLTNGTTCTCTYDSEGFMTDCMTWDSDESLIEMILYKDDGSEDEHWTYEYVTPFKKISRLIDGEMVVLTMIDEWQEGLHRVTTYHHDIGTSTVKEYTKIGGMKSCDIYGEEIIMSEIHYGENGDVTCHIRYEYDPEVSALRWHVKREFDKEDSLLSLSEWIPDRKEVFVTHYNKYGNIDHYETKWFTEVKVQAADGAYYYDLEEHSRVIDAEN